MIAIILRVEYNKSVATKMWDEGDIGQHKNCWYEIYEGENNRMTNTINSHERIIKRIKEVLQSKKAVVVSIVKEII